MLGPGDPGAEHFEGRPLETVLYVNPLNEPMTALLLEREIWVYPGWIDADEADFLPQRSRQK